MKYEQKDAVGHGLLLAIAVMLLILMYRVSDLDAKVTRLEATRKLEAGR